jgi:Protein of unknown function (DUF2442)
VTTLVLEKEPVAVKVSLSARHLAIALADGRCVLIPLEWYPRLMNASTAERQNWRLLGDGYAIEWPDLDEHIGVEGLLAGHPSGESAHSLSRWLESRANKKRAIKAKKKAAKP